MGIREDALADIDQVLARVHDKSNAAVSEEAVGLHACIGRYSSHGSSYTTEANTYVAMSRNASVGGYGVDRLKGLLRSLRRDIEAGHLRNVESLVSAGIFTDLLGQAEHLVEGSYRRAAAVLAGGTLEEHLRKLAAANGVPLQDAQGKPKKASALNAELYKANVLGKAEQAQVDAWQKIRNDAAHGTPDFETVHTDADIARMISGIRDFVVKHPP